MRGTKRAHRDLTDAFRQSRWSLLNVCEHTVKMVHNDILSKSQQGRNKMKGGVEGMEGKFNVNYLRLIPGLF